MAEEELTVRPCREEELAAWGELCALGFSHRPGPRDRFYRRYLCDPSARPDWVRVVVTSSGMLIGSVRVFHRLMVINGSPTAVAGLGEVCTHPEYRGKGVSTIMLMDAIQFAEGCSRAAVSALHAAPAVNALYARFGYEALRVPYARLRLREGERLPVVTLGGVRYFARRVAWPHDVPHLMALHDDYMRRLAVSGYTVRGVDYWRMWMPNVVGDALWLLHAAGGEDDADEGGMITTPSVEEVLGLPTTPGEGSTDVSMSPVGSASSMAAVNAPPHGHSSSALPLAYASVIRKPDGYKLCDYAADARLSPDVCTWLITHAARGVIDADLASGVVMHSDAVTRDVLLPAAVMHHMNGDTAASVAGQHDTLADVGWMVRALHGSTADDAVLPGASHSGEEVVHALRAASAAGRFFVWVSDSF